MIKSCSVHEAPTMKPQLRSTFVTRWMGMFVIVCYLQPTVERKSEIDSKFQLLHKYSTSAFEEQKLNIVKKTMKFPFQWEAKYLTAVTGYLGAALGNNERNHERVITWNQHLISMCFFIRFDLWLSINSLDVQKSPAFTHTVLYLNS